MTIILILTLLAPYFVFLGVKKAKAKDIATHRKIQMLVFAVCMLGLFGLEALIRVSGGSGSISGKSSFAENSVFKTILVAHILGAVLTYTIWFFQIVLSILQYRRTLPGKFSFAHRILGKITFIGLIYTAVTALIVYIFTIL